MARPSDHHQTLTNGVGKCSVPMWMNGLPAGFCDEPAYGPPEPGQRRYGSFVPARGRWLPHYVPALACYHHGGPEGPACPDCGAPAGPDHHAPTRDHLGTAISECDANRISQDGP